MTIRTFATVVVCLVGCFVVIGCGSPEQKPLTAQDKAKMMDRSDVPKGYLEAAKQRMGGNIGGAKPGTPGPAMPPQGAASGGAPTGQ